MIMLVAATVIVAALTCIVLVAGRKSDSSRLIDWRPSVLVAAVQIICGDCAGQEESPRRTYLDGAGRCSTCGGQSYVLATSVALNALENAFRTADYAGMNPGRRVIPFELPANRASRSEKIA